LYYKDILKGIKKHLEKHSLSSHDLQKLQNDSNPNLTDKEKKEMEEKPPPLCKTLMDKINNNGNDEE
jgi:hypothetical protein